MGRPGGRSRKGFAGPGIVFVYPAVANADRGKPLFKASDGGRLDVLRESEDSTWGELRQVSETKVLIG